MCDDPVSATNTVDVSNCCPVMFNRTPGHGHGSEGMTPQPGGVLTPRGAVTPGLTPGRTPLRDKLNINSEEQLADPAFAKHLVNTHSLFAIFNITTFFF